MSLSRWRTTERLILNNIGYHKSVFDALNSNRSSDAYPDLVLESFPEFCGNQVNAIIHKFLADEFTRQVSAGDEDTYKMSAAIAERLFGKIAPKHGDEARIPPYREFCGIMYPSLAMSANADNVALLPKFADRYLTLEQVEYLRIDGAVGERQYQYTPIDFANTFTCDGKIEWKGRVQRWTVPNDGSVTPRDEGGETIFRDKMGNIVHPT